MIFIISQHVIEKHHSHDNVKTNSKDRISSLSKNRSNSSSNATIETDDGTASSSKNCHSSDSQDSVNHNDCPYSKRRIECDSPISSSQFPNVLDEDQYVEYPHPNDDSESYEELGYGHYAPALHDEHQCSSSNQDKAHRNAELYRQTSRVDHAEDSDEENEGEGGCEDYEHLEKAAYDDCSFDDDELIEQHDDSTERVLEEKPSMMQSKPFFIMDFLEQVDPDDLKLAQSMLLSKQNKDIKSKMHRSPSWHNNMNGTKDEDQNIFQQLTKKLSFFNVAAANKNEKNKDILAATEKRKHTTDCSSSSCLKPICKDLFTRKIIQPMQEERCQQLKRNVSSSTELCHQQHERVSSTCLSAPALSDSPSSSCFFHQSVTIGNKYNARGIHYATTGEWKKALFYWKDALEIRIQVLGKMSIDVADTCNNIGIALGKLQRHEEALTAFHRALQIQTEYYQNHSNESDHNNINTASGTIDADRVTSKRACHLIATTYHNMGNIYQQSNACYNAIQCYRECETILKMIYGPEHLEVARSLVAMGHTYRQAAADETSSKEGLALSLKSNPVLSVQRYENNIRDCCYSYYYEDAKQAYIDALRIFDLLGLQRNNPEVKSIIDDISALENRIKMCL